MPINGHAHSASLASLSAQHAQPIDQERVSVSAVAWYVAITYVWSWGCWALLIIAKFEPFSRSWSLAYVAGLSGPLVAAVCRRWIEAGTLGVRSLLLPLTHWKVSPTAYTMAVFLPVAVVLFAGLRHAPLLAAGAKAVALAGIPMLFLKMLVRGGPLNEEVGWRGYMLPLLLSRLSPFAASLVVWPIWSLWHAPLWLIPGVQQGAWPMGLFMLLMFPITFVFTGVYRLGKGSLLPPILLHTVTNMAMYFSPLLAIYNSHLTAFFLRLNVLWFGAMAIVIIKQRDWFTAPRERYPSEVVR